VVYITEAHPSDIWQMQSNIRDKVIFANPQTEEERAFVAGACVRKLGIKIPAVLDEFGNSTERAYTGWPDRLYVIDAAGHVVYKSKPGPFGFKPDELKPPLARVISRAGLSVNHQTAAGAGEEGAGSAQTSAQTYAQP
jgi:Iodothyronine deiodinase